MSPSFTWRRIRSGAGTPDPWRKSRYSMANGNCMEDRSGPVLAFGRDTWTRFIAEVKAS